MIASLILFQGQSVGLRGWRTMIIPVVCFVLGVFVLLFAVLVYGSALFREVPEHLKKRDLITYFLGYVLVAVALMLGLAGDLEHLDSVILRPTRFVMGTIGAILLFYQYIEVLSRP